MTTDIPKDCPLSDACEAAAELSRLRSKLRRIAVLANRAIDTGGREELHPDVVAQIADPEHPLADDDPWQPIATAKRDGTLVWVYTAPRDGLPAFQSACAYHPDAGWCTDELREVTHWAPQRTVWLPPPKESTA